MIITLRSIDHPEANGRHPKIGEQWWTLSVPLENGQDYLELHLGRRGREAIRGMLDQEDADDAEAAGGDHEDN